MLKRKKPLFIASLMPIVLICLSSCAKESYESVCPVYPIAGPKVAEELEHADALSATWEWIGRLDKLRQELEICN